MDGLRKLNRLAEKLLDTGKRNHLINFKDTKLSSGEVVFPDTESVFSKCSVGHAFTIYDPKLEVVEDIDYPEAVQTTNIIGKQAYIERYSKYHF